MLKRGLVSKMQRDLPANPTAAQRATAAAEVEEAFAKIDMIAQAKLERFEAEQFKTLKCVCAACSVLFVQHALCV